MFAKYIKTFLVFVTVIYVAVSGGYTYANIQSRSIKDDEKINWEVVITPSKYAPPGSYTTVLVLYPGITLANLNADNYNNLEKTIKYIDQVDTSSLNGSDIIFKITMDKEDPTGYYTIASSYIKDTTYITGTSRFYYLSQPDRISYMNAINDLSLDATGMSGIIDKNKKYYMIIGLNYSFYGQYVMANEDLKKYLAQSLINRRPTNGYDEKTLITIFNELTAIIAVNQSIDKNQLKTIVNDINTLYEQGIYKVDGDYSKLTESETGTEYIYNYLYSLKNIKPFDGITDGQNNIKKSFEFALAAALLNNTDETQLAMVIDNYNEILGIEKSDYNEYKNNSNLRVEINKLLSGTQFIDPANISKTFKEKVMNFKRNSQPIITKKSNSVIRFKQPNPTETPIPTPIDIIPDVSSKFIDMEEFKWAEGAVNKLYSNGILNGVGTGIFKPKDNVTREQFIKMVVKAFGLKSSGLEVNYKDVRADDWFYSYITTAVENGIMTGYDNNTFGVGRYITREDMSTVIYRVLKKAGVGFNNTADISFDDKGNISVYAFEGICKLYNAGIIKGYNKKQFAPKELSNRAQAAALVYNAMSFIEGR